jgi:hypothetical protein
MNEYADVLTDCRNGTIESTKQLAKETAVQLKELNTTTGTLEQRNVRGFLNV